MKKISDFGTYEDDTVNSEYCHYCYKLGKFTDPSITMDEKIAKNIAIAEKMGIPREQAINMANSTIPKLKRCQ